MSSNAITVFCLMLWVFTLYYTPHSFSLCMSLTKWRRLLAAETLYMAEFALTKCEESKKGDAISPRLHTPSYESHFEGTVLVLVLMRTFGLSFVGTAAPATIWLARKSSRKWARLTGAAFSFYTKRELTPRKSSRAKQWQTPRKLQAKFPGHTWI